MKNPDPVAPTFYLELPASQNKYTGTITAVYSSMVNTSVAGMRLIHVRERKQCWYLE